MLAIITCICCGKQADRKPQSQSRMCLACVAIHAKEGLRAIAIVHGAVGRGEIPKATVFACVDCAKPAREYDHRDYLKPLDIVPVCRSCNHKRGAALNSILRTHPAPLLNKTVRAGIWPELVATPTRGAAQCQ